MVDMLVELKVESKVVYLGMQKVDLRVAWRVGNLVERLVEKMADLMVE